jgi:ABC-type transport system involved in cytochrome bd biosynthesis fused ATPase/permease subunit
MAVPFLYIKGLSVGEIAARYRESDSLIQGASSAIGDLMMVYKKVQKLAGYTARVVELLESIDAYKSIAKSTVFEATSITFEDVTIRSPDDRLLLKDLNLCIGSGENLIVTGANGAGLCACIAHYGSDFNSSRAFTLTDVHCRENIALPSVGRTLECFIRKGWPPGKFGDGQ